MPGGHHQDAALTKQSRPLWRRRYATELSAGDAGNPVVTGKRLVQERVVGAPELDGVAILAQLAEKEEFGFLRHGGAECHVVIREERFVRIGLLELIESQPRKEEAFDEGTGASVVEHACDLPLE